MDWYSKITLLKYKRHASTSAINEELNLHYLWNWWCMLCSIQNRIHFSDLQTWRCSKSQQDIREQTVYSTWGYMTLINISLFPSDCLIPIHPTEKVRAQQSLTSVSRCKHPKYFMLFTYILYLINMIMTWLEGIIIGSLNVWELLVSQLSKHRQMSFSFVNNFSKHFSIIY